MVAAERLADSQVKQLEDSEAELGEGLEAEGPLGGEVEDSSKERIGSHGLVLQKKVTALMVKRQSRRMLIHLPTVIVGRTALTRCCSSKLGTTSAWPSQPRVTDRWISAAHPHVCLHTKVKI